MNSLKNGLQYIFNNSSPPVKYHGLMNQGATCYLNSVLQVLFMTEDFRAAVKRHMCENPDTECIDRHLKTLFDDLEERTAYTYNITNKLGIDRVYEQRDAAEYFEKILNLTCPEASQIFHGESTNKTRCSTCGTETDADEAFWHLPLALVESYSEHYSVLDGIEEYFKASEFKGENQMYCDNCDAKSDATTRCVIKRHPDVLMLLLKRFEFDYRYMKYVKINCTVDVPCTLQIPENQTYELYAVVDHVGDLRSGHYTTTIKDDERWYEFNDTTVTSLDYQPFQVDNLEKSRDAYLLFYRRKERAANTCTQDIRETPGGFPPADTCDQRADALQTEEVEGTEEMGEDTVVTVSIGTNAETGTKDRVGSRGVGLSPDLCSNVEDQDKGVHAGQRIPNNHQDRDDLSYLQNAHADEGKREDKEDTEENAEAEKRETLSRETHLEESVEVQDSDREKQRTLDISHDFKPDVGDRHAVHRNKKDEMSDAERRVMDVKTDEDGKEKKGESLTKYYRDTKGLEDVQQNISEDLEATEEAGQDHDLKSVSVDKQGDKERKERDIKADKKVKTGERGMASGSGRLLTKYDLCYSEIEVSNSQRKMPKDDQGGSRRDKRHELREEKREVKGDRDQKRGDDKHAQRREMSGRQQDFGQGRSGDVRQSRSEQKISVTHTRHKDVGEERQSREHEKKEENRAKSSLRRVEKTRQGDSESNEGRVKGRRGSDKSTPTYVITDDEIKDGIHRITETKYIIPQRTSQDSIKSCVENSEGNVRGKCNQKTDANVSLSEGVRNLKLGERETKRHRSKGAIGNVHQVSETKRTIHSFAKNKQKVSDSQERAAGRERVMEKRAEIKMKWLRLSSLQKQQRKEKRNRTRVSCSSLTRKSQSQITTSEKVKFIRLIKKKQKVSDTQERSAGREHVMEKRADKKTKWLHLSASQKQQRKEKKKQNKTFLCLPFSFKSHRNADQTSESD